MPKIIKIFLWRKGIPCRILIKIVTDFMQYPQWKNSSEKNIHKLKKAILTARIMTDIIVP